MGRPRHYDSKIGRWVTKDPIGFAGSDANLYAYVGGNPMSYNDPTGLFLNLPGATIGFITGAVGGYTTGGILGAAGGGVVGAGVGLIIPTSSGVAGAAAGGFISSLLGQVVGNAATGNSLGRIDAGQAVVGSFSAATGGAATAALRVSSVAGQSAVCSGVDAATNAILNPITTGPVDFCVIATGKQCPLH